MIDKQVEELIRYLRRIFYVLCVIGGILYVLCVITGILAAHK